MKKVPLILVTGLLSDKRVFAYPAEKLKNSADITIVELTDVNSPSAMTEKVLSLAPDRFALAGHSIGGWIALRIAKTTPDRVVKLCLLNTSARGASPEEVCSRQSVLTRIQNGQFQQVAKEIANQFVFNKVVKKNVLNMFLQVGEKAMINQTLAMMSRESLNDSLPKILCPTLIIHANEDKRFTLEMHEAMFNKIPNSKLAIIDDCGHMSPMESPYAVTTLMRFWLDYF